MEFYCGVGGLHYSLLRARPTATVAAAFDINPNSNDVYEHNFGVRPWQKNLFGKRGVDTGKLDKLAASLWLLSPPCQPFTRQGLQKDTSDARSQSFLRLLDVVPNLRHPPTHILVENVVGFETSEMRGVLLETLRGLGFTTREYILSPRQFGVPYSRPRYFLLAKRAPLRWIDDGDGGDVVGVGVGGEMMAMAAAGGTEAGERLTAPLRRKPPPSRLSTPSEWVPGGASGIGMSLLRDVDPVEATVARVKPPPGGVGVKDLNQKKKTNDDDHEEKEEETTAKADEGRVLYGVAPLSCFMEEENQYDDDDDQWKRKKTKTNTNKTDLWREYGVPQKEVYKSLAAIDVVLPTDRKCNCFTKSYGRYVKGTGSFVANREVMKGSWDGTVVNGGVGVEAGKKCGGGEDGDTDADTDTARGAGGGGKGTAGDAADGKKNGNGMTTTSETDMDRGGGGGGGGGGGDDVMLRYFTEREVANIHSFPPEFSFPAHITRGQRYALLGNSLSVACVAPLIDYLLTDDDDDDDDLP